MIVSFGDRVTEALFHGDAPARLSGLPPEVLRGAPRKLDMINAASPIGDVASPPGNRLEALPGDRRGFHSIRINEQWRIVFRWIDGDAHDVSVVDYHS